MAVMMDFQIVVDRAYISLRVRRNMLCWIFVVMRLFVIAMPYLSHLPMLANHYFHDLNPLSLLSYGPSFPFAAIKTYAPTA